MNNTEQVIKVREIANDSDINPPKLSSLAMLAKIKVICGEQFSTKMT